jgi:hypothetical protein
MIEKQAEFIDTESFFHHEKYISRERKSYFSHIDSDRSRSCLDTFTHSFEYLDECHVRSEYEFIHSDRVYI